MFKRFRTELDEDTALAFIPPGIARRSNADVVEVDLVREIDVEHFGVDLANAKPEGTPGGGNGGGGNGGGGNGGGGGDGGATFDPYTSGAEGAFNITIVFEGTWTQALYDIFVAAADFYSALIVGDLQDVSITTGRGKKATTTTIDDVQITASLINIDGAGGVLGRAGPSSVRTDNSLTVEGIMEFDIADADTFNAAGLFDDIVVHEMAHVLGLGTLWDRLGLLLSDNTFGGALASAEHALQFNGDDTILIETDGGQGTAFGHWDDETYGNELFTGFISDPNYISYWSAASFADLGYELNPNYRQVVDEYNLA